MNDLDCIDYLLDAKVQAMIGEMTALSCHPSAVVISLLSLVARNSIHYMDRETTLEAFAVIVEEMQDGAYDHMLGEFAPIC